MTVLVALILISLALGAIGLVAFLWSLDSGQYNDLDGAAERILLDEKDRPLPKALPGRPRKAVVERERDSG